jgi:hypothetical protein
VVLLPAATVCDAGDDDNEKSGTTIELTVKVTLAECASDALLSVPVMATV